MKLHTWPLTCNAIKVSLLLNQLQLTPDIELIRLNRGEQRKAEFLALNPNGTIPVLEDGDEVIWESNAILYYLARKYESVLYPQTPQQEVELIRWLSWQQGCWNSASAPFAHHRVVRAYWGGEADENTLTALMPEFRQRAQLLDEHLADQAFMFADQPSIADIAIASTLFFWREAQIPLTEFSHLYDWQQRLEAFAWWQSCHQQLTAFREHHSFSGHI